MTCRRDGIKTKTKMKTKMKMKTRALFGAGALRSDVVL